MKQFVFIPLFLLFLGAHITVLGQQQNPLIVSGDLLGRASELYDSGAYKKAIAVYEKIDLNDTNYVQALYGLGICYYADSQFSKSVYYNEKALLLDSNSEKLPDIYNQYGDSIDAAGNPGRALRIFDSAILKYPSYSLLYLNKGTVLLKLHQYAEAEEMFKQALLINPYSYSSHYLLGLCALNEGKLMPAFFSLIGYLLMTPEGKYHSTCIGLLSSISSNTDEVQRLVSARKTDPDENYQLLEQIVQSKIALDKNYKPIIKLDDRISRQIQVVLEKLDYQESDSDFYMQYYVPFFKACYTGNHFENFINHIFSSVDIPALKEYAKKNKKELSALVEDAVDYFNLIRNTRELNYIRRDQASMIWSFSHGDLVGHGKYLAKEDKLLGPWEYYYSPGNIKSRGLYNEEGKKEGPWVYYYFNGKVRGREIYQNGKQTGEETYYFSDGSISTHSWYKDGVPDGESVAYFLTGAIRTITQYKSGKEEGPQISFFNNGDTSYLKTYKGGVENGLTKSWFQNKKVEFISYYTNGKIDGPYEKYFDNGRLSMQGNYVMDKQEGIWKYFHPNGQLKDEQRFVSDKQEGDHKEFYDNGVVNNTFTDKHGKIDGEARYYDDDGNLFCVYHYENDQLQKAEYFDKTGRPVGRSDRNHKTIELTEYLPDGTKKMNGTFNQKDNVSGTETFFYPSGKIFETDEYLDGQEQGPSVAYYIDGTKKNESPYANGKLNGFHKSFYSNGQIQEEGWYKDNNACGYWLSYDELGKLTDSTYYNDGEVCGIKKTFLPDGSKEFEFRYRSGWLRDWAQFDSTGRLLQDNHFPGSTGKLLLVYPDGKHHIEGQYFRDRLEGAYLTFYPDGRKMAVESYVRGMEDGSYKTYFHSGLADIEGQYRYGVKIGTWKYHFRDGKLKMTVDYVDGKLNGKQTSYFKNGKVESELNYKDDNRNGPLKRFDPSGVLLYQVTFKDNRPLSYTWLDKNGGLLGETAIPAQSAKIKAFFPNGNVSAEFEYKDGVVDGPCTFFFPNGRIRTQYTNKYGNIEGAYKDYFDNGQLATDCFYLQGNLHGQYKEYNEKGMVVETGNYYDGSLHGIVQLFDDKGNLHETDFYHYGKILSIK